MDGQTEKCVMVLDEGLPPGLVANTAGILGITLGKHIPEAVGPDVTDRSGRTHLGIIEFPVPILRADRETLYELRERLYEPAFAALTAVDFSDVAQGCKTYDEFIAKARTDWGGQPALSGACHLRREKAGEQADRQPASPALILIAHHAQYLPRAAGMHQMETNGCAK